jgi:hypothetical protein
MDDLWMNTPPRPPRFVWTDGPTYTTDGQVPLFCPISGPPCSAAAGAAEEELRLEGLSHMLFWLFFPISGCSQDCRRMVILRCRWLVTWKEKIICGCC